MVDGEDAQEIWPATAAWFLGPKAENLELLKSLVEKAWCTFIDSLEPEQHGNTFIRFEIAPDAY